MINKYQEGVIGNTPKGEHDETAYNEALAACKFDRALDEVWERIRGLNQYIDEEKPWQIAKRGEQDHLQEVLAYQAGALLEIAKLLKPFLPQTADKIASIFQEGVVRPIEDTLFPRKD